MRAQLPTPGQQLLAHAAEHASLQIRVCSGYCLEDGTRVYCGEPIKDEQPFAVEVNPRLAGLSHGIGSCCIAKWRRAA